MQVTGYQLREAIKRATQRCEMARNVFKDSATGFDDEAKDPIKAAIAFDERGTDVALLQALQQTYNQNVVLQGIKVRDMPVTLAVGVKLVGHAGAVEKEWRNMASAKRDRYSSDPATERDTSKIYARKLVTPAMAVARSEVAGAFAAQLRAAIAVANNTTLDMDIDPALLS